MYIACLFFICLVEKVYILCQNQMAIHLFVIQNHPMDSLSFQAHCCLHGFTYKFKLGIILISDLGDEHFSTNDSCNRVGNKTSIKLILSPSHTTQRT